MDLAIGESGELYLLPVEGSCCEKYFIEEKLGLKNEGDWIKLVRVNMKDCNEIMWLVAKGPPEEN